MIPLFLDHDHRLQDNDKERKKGVGEKEKGRSIIKEIESGGPILKVVVVL